MIQCGEPTCLESPRRKAGNMAFRQSRFVQDERGSMTTMFALVMPFLIGGIAFGVEVSTWLMLERQTQNAADMAAFSAAVNLSLMDDEEDAVDRAEQVAFGSGLSRDTAVVDVEFISQTGVAVEISIQYPRYFTRLFSDSDVTIRARAVADIVVGDAAAACLLVLDSRDDSTLELDGGSVIDMPDCAIEVHSRDDDGLDISGSAEISAACLSVRADEVDDRDAERVSDLGCGSIVTDAPLNGDLPERLQQIVEREEDSLRDFVDEVPRYRGDRTIRGGVLTPEDVGHPSGIPMMRFDRDVTLSDEITLMPGIYIVDDAELRTRNNTVLNGEAGVMFYLVDGGELDFHSGTDASLRGLTGFEGSIFQDVVMLNDGDDEEYTFEAGEWTGIILLPEAEIEIGGGRSIDGCFLFAAQRFQMQGNSRIDVLCEDSAFDPSLYAGTGGGPGSGGNNSVIFLVE